ncbi:hypothetical protein [Amylibacter sp. IMCC11727]|uniref:hypothetical protein n=1 Tax=Amylibacter sp. IMCC11727 TaxID=3039851 RepID=UPI00244E4AEF|nr:hypothetical protein [Amylibacter sp. IMCC11727]WGI22962.1 hypothetical protein QBD29_05955 [Amylibacter sp. IMCC11727]
MTKTLFLIRALRFDPVAAQLADTLTKATGQKVVFVCDESRGSTDTAGYDKIALTPGRLKTLGLAKAPDDWGWFWGDVCYYAALARYAEYDYYCLIESDVFLSKDAAAQFVDRLSRQHEDALAVRLGPMDAPQKYSRPLEFLGLDPKWGCIFPVSRVHRSVIRSMLKLRKRSIEQTPNGRLNDEGVLVGAIQEGGYSHAALDQILPDVFRPKTFDTNPPHLFEPLMDGPDLGHAFHPVVRFETVMERIENKYKNYGRHRLRMVLRAASPDMRAKIEAVLD